MGPNSERSTQATAIVPMAASVPKAMEVRLERRRAARNASGLWATSAKRFWPTEIGMMKTTQAIIQTLYQIALSEGESSSMTMMGMIQLGARSVNVSR